MMTRTALGDHLANERTFLAWLRTGVAIIVFGFAIGRFAIAIRQLQSISGKSSETTGLSVWLGTVAIVAGVVLTVAGLIRYRRVRAQLESGRFEPAGSRHRSHRHSRNALWISVGGIPDLHRTAVVMPYYAPTRFFYQGPGPAA